MRKGKLISRIILMCVIICAVILSVFQFTGLPDEARIAIQKAKLWTGLFNADNATMGFAGSSLVPEEHFNLNLRSSEGEFLKLADYRGKVIFINYWASWCPPCIAEMPTIDELYASVKDNKNIEIILLSLDEEPEMAKAFMNKHKYVMPYYFPESKLPETLQYSFIPTTFVISPQGAIIYKKAGMADYSTPEFEEWLISNVEK